MEVRSVPQSPTPERQILALVVRVLHIPQGPIPAGPPEVLKVGPGNLPSLAVWAPFMAIMRRQHLTKRAWGTRSEIVHGAAHDNAGVAHVFHDSSACLPERLGVRHGARVEISYAPRRWRP